MNSKLYETEAMQCQSELDRFCELVKAENASSYLEIGAKFGGSLWRVAQVLKPGSRIVAVDLPGGTVKWTASEPSLASCCQALLQLGHNPDVIWGDSTDPFVVKQVFRSITRFDVVMIDANHTIPYLRKDWHNYGTMGRMVAFHDIAWSRPLAWDGVRIEVSEFWNELKSAYRHEEIKLDSSGQDNGIGVLWR